MRPEFVPAKSIHASLCGCQGKARAASGLPGLSLDSALLSLLRKAKNTPCYVQCITKNEGVFLLENKNKYQLPNAISGNPEIPEANAELCRNLAGWLVATIAVLLLAGSGDCLTF
jgi:hypothetical protein